MNTHNIFMYSYNWATARQNQQNDMRPAKTQISLGITQSDQSLCCPHEEILGPIEHTVKTLIRLDRVFAGHTCYFVGFVVRRLN